MDSGRRSDARGVTLVELLVVLAVLGVMAGVVGLAWRPGVWFDTQTRENGGLGTVTMARSQALESGRRVKFLMPAGKDSVELLALPDGRVIGGERLHVDALSGRRVAGGVP